MVEEKRQAIVATREEIIAHIRAVNRTCRGNPVFPEKMRKMLTDILDPIVEARDVTTGKQLLVSLCRVLKIPLPEIVPADDFEAIYREVFGLIFACEDRVGRGCGADFNEILISGPWDGDRHDYICPKCGINSFYIAPCFEVKNADHPKS